MRSQGRAVLGGKAILAMLAGSLLVLVASRAQAATITILDESFEGSFPGDNGWVLSGSPSWDVASYRASSGSWSAWCAGSTLSPPGPYAPDMNAQMKYGPFDLSDATSGSITFKAWTDVQADSDYLKWLVSINGTNFYGLQSSTSTSGSWTTKSLDLTDVYTLGNICGQPQVWFKIIFRSDSVLELEGAYVDDILVQKTVPDDPYEPNDSYSEAWDFGGGEQAWLSSYGGASGIQCDEDWFKIVVSSGYERVVVACTFSHSLGNIDIELCESLGSVFAPVSGSRTSFTTTDNESIDCVVPSSGTYYIRVLGADAGNVYDLWWDDLVPPPVEAVSAPNAPFGQGMGGTGTVYSYSSDGASSNLGHSLEYSLNWGDGSNSPWRTSASADHIWGNPGTYLVRARARCADHPSVVSDWSPPSSVTITDSGLIGGGCRPLVAGEGEGALAYALVLALGAYATLVARKRASS